MLYQEYIKKCNPETRDFIIKSLVFNGCICNSSNMIIKKYFPSSQFFNSENQYYLGILYFFILNVLLKTNLGDIILDNQIVSLDNIFDDYTITKINEKLADIEQAFASDVCPLYCLERIFNNNSSFSSFLRAYGNLQETITLEKIFLNYYNDNKHNEFVDVFKKIWDINNIASQLKHYEKKSINYLSCVEEITIDCGENITFKEYPFNPLIGRQEEFLTMCALINHRQKSLIIHGLPGVGKTALVEGLAYSIQKGLAPKSLLNKQIIALCGTDLVAGTKYVGTLEEKMLKIINQLKNTNTLLFIDEIHTLMGLGQGENECNDVSNILKPYLGNGSLKIIGATSTKEYNRILENPAFARRFNSLEIKPLNNNEVLKIMTNIIEQYQITNNMSFLPDPLGTQILNLIIEFTNLKHQNYYFTKELYNPDFALTILDNAYAFASLNSQNTVTINNIISAIKCIDFINDTLKNDFIFKINNLPPLSTRSLKPKKIIELP